MSSTPADKVIQPSARCPYCHSTNVTRGDKPTPSSYWRCDGCGQMWHSDRLQRNIEYRGGRAETVIGGVTTAALALKATHDRGDGEP